jgi:hypothetical protein
MNDVLKIMAITALLVVAGSFWLSSEMTSVQQVDPGSVNLRFRVARDQFEDATPMRVRDASGQVLHHRIQDQRIVPAAPADVVILAWRGPDKGLVESRVPIWLLGLAQPLRDWMLRDSGFDPADWSLSVNDIQSAGLGIVVDHVDRDGTRTLVWAE